MATEAEPSKAEPEVVHSASEAAETSRFNVDAAVFTPQKEIEDVLQQLPLRHKQMLRGFYVANTGEYVSYYVGTLKTFNVKNGYGFIECKQAKVDWGVDVFVHKNNVPTPWNLGQPVEFAVQVNQRSQPQAYDCNWLPRLQSNSVTPGTTAALPGRGPYPNAADAPAREPVQETLSNEPRRLGTLKSYSFQHGYGFIQCEETTQAYKRDVYLDKSQVGESWNYGQLLEFSVSFNERGQPQARQVNWDPVPVSGDPITPQRTFHKKTVSELKRLLKLLHDKNNETAVVTAIDLQGGANAAEASQEDQDVDYVFFVLDRLGPKAEALKSIKDFVRMLFVLMLSRMLKLQKSRAKTLQIIEWFQAVAENIQISSESVQLHIQDVLRQINQHILQAVSANTELADTDLAAQLHAAFKQLQEKAQSPKA